MILLPTGPKILLPQKKAEWSPSLSLRRDQFGNEERKIVFCLTGYLSDGAKRKFWFEDRDDADAFLHAMAMGTLVREPELWRLPVPNWHPDIGEGLVYEFATVTFLSSTSQATYTKPSDWNDANNFIASVGGGGSGGCSNRASSINANASGGGGGGFGIYNNLTLSGNATYQCGIGGAAKNRTTAGQTAGSDGLETYFNGATYAAAPTGATPGIGGKASSSTAASAAGGTGKGTGSNSGGASGAAAATSNSASATGGGGAGGPNGAGVASAATSNSSGRASTDGGNGDASLGGVGGGAATAASPGGDGTEYGSAGSGGGGGGSSGAVGTHGTGGAGGNYGGGGGGASSGSTSTADTNLTSGAGTQGNIVVSYTPIVPASGFNLAMMGM